MLMWTPKIIRMVTHKADTEGGRRPTGVRSWSGVS
jgi:hypothetical protein